MSRAEGCGPVCSVPWVSASFWAAMTSRQDLGLGLLVALLRPDAAQDQVVLQAQDRIAERPGVGLGLRPIGRGIVRGRVRADAIGDVFDQRRPEIAARPLDRPFRHGVHGEIVVAVDPQRRDAEAEAARGEGARAAAGDALEGRDRPLVVDDVQHHRRLVGRGEDQRGVEVRFGRRAVADPAGGDPGVALDRRGHRPADGLDVLRGEVARDREEAVLARGVHHRQLAALQRVELVGVDLVHHLDHRIAVGDQQPGLAVGREVHVARLERLAEGAAHRLLAHVLHVERRLALALRHLHARIEGAQRHHVAQALQQLGVAQQAGPRTDRLAVAVEHADDLVGVLADLLGRHVDRRPLDLAGAADLHVAEVRRTAWPDGRSRHVERQRFRFGHDGLLVDRREHHAARPINGAAGCFLRKQLR